MPEPPTRAEVERALRELVTDAPDYPCVMARSVFARDQFDLGVYPELGAGAGEALGRDLLDFYGRPAPERGFRSFLAVFAGPAETLPEEDFERRLWETLGALHALDLRAGRPWDDAVAMDPRSPDFSFSFGGTATYVIGLHPGASRPARRFGWPMLVFNLHSQFEALRAEGRYPKVRDLIRDRDRAFAGSVNPMVADFGQASEASQYSGRAVDDDWRCPFHPDP